jgi:hypothetical protein
VAERAAALIKTLEQKRSDIDATLRELQAIHEQCTRYLCESGLSCEKDLGRSTRK